MPSRAMSEPEDRSKVSVAFVVEHLEIFDCVVLDHRVDLTVDPIALHAASEDLTEGGLLCIGGQLGHVEPGHREPLDDLADPEAT